MIYLSWAIFAEGPSDYAYLNVLIPRVMEGLALSSGTRAITVPPFSAVELGVKGRRVVDVSNEICAGREAFDLLFVHGDTGGAAQQTTLAERTSAYLNEAYQKCGFRLDRGVLVTPKKETEAWVISDRDAILGAAGVSQIPNGVNLPQNGAAAEADADPKATLKQFMIAARGRRRRSGIEIPFEAIAQRQSLTQLRTSPTFAAFEQDLRAAMGTMGCFS